MLYQLGSVTFEVAPVNVHEIEQEFGADFAAKDLLGARRSREFMGPADGKIELSGKLFPHKFGGLSAIDMLEQMAESGEPQILVRGDGLNLQWHLIEKVSVKSSYLDANGVGRVIDFKISLVRSSRSASAGSILRTLYRLALGA